MQEPQSESNRDSGQSEADGDKELPDAIKLAYDILGRISADSKKARYGSARTPSAGEKRDEGSAKRFDASAEDGPAQQAQNGSEPDTGHSETGSDLISSEDAEHMNDLLARITEPLVPDVDALNGFLTALVCSPRPLHFDAILKFIMARNDGKDTKGHGAPFQSLDEAKWFMELLRSHLVDLHYILSDDRRCYKPYIRCTTKPGNSWAAGFASAVSWLMDDWEEIYHIQHRREEMVMLMVLASDNNEDDSRRLMYPEEADAMRGEILDVLPDIVQSVYDHFEEKRKVNGDTYPMFFSRYNISVIDPNDDSDPETRRAMEKYGADRIKRSDGASTEAENTRKKKGGGKSKRKRW